MSIEDDIALLARVPSLNLLGMSALQVLAIGAEQYDYGFGDVLFHKGDIADAMRDKGAKVDTVEIRPASENTPSMPSRRPASAK